MNSLLSNFKYKMDELERSKTKKVKLNNELKERH